MIRPRDRVFRLTCQVFTSLSKVEFPADTTFHGIRRILAPFWIQMMICLPKIVRRIWPPYG